MTNEYDLKTERIKLILIYATYGTIGTVTYFIPLSSSAIVFYRALLGGLFIIFLTCMRGASINIKSMKENLPILILTGFFMGLNWVFQFEAFRVSTVAIGTVCYNTMPIFLLIIASIMFKEKITFKSIICIIVASIGVVLVSNVINTGIRSNEVLGCFYGILGAIFYALIVTYNKKLNQIETHDKVIFQFLFSAFIMFVYVMLGKDDSLFFNQGISQKDLTIGILCLLLLCFFHTGFCYVHYFNAVSRLKAETVAILTYIDPVVALFLSYFVLREQATGLQILGAMLILISMFVNNLISD